MRIFPYFFVCKLILVNFSIYLQVTLLVQQKNHQEQSDAQLASRSAECAEMLDRVLKHRESAPQEVETEQ